MGSERGVEIGSKMNNDERKDSKTELLEGIHGNAGQQATGQKNVDEEGGPMNRPWSADHGIDNFGPRISLRKDSIQEIRMSNVCYPLSLSSDKELSEARKYLEEIGEMKDSVWLHLSAVLGKLLDEHPSKVIDYFDEYSRRVRRSRCLSSTDHLFDIYTKPRSLVDAKQTLDLLKSTTIVKQFGESIDEDEIEPDKETVNITEHMQYFSQVGVRLPEQEIVRLNIALSKLYEDFPVANVRFWGKILGTENDYYVAECDLTEEELIRRNEVLLGEDEEGKEELESSPSNEIADQPPDVPVVDDTGFIGPKLQEVLDQTPSVQMLPTRGMGKSYSAGEGEGEGGEGEGGEGGAGGEGGGEEEEETVVVVKTRLQKYKPPRLPVAYDIPEVVVPPERSGEGVNKKVYLVSNRPEGVWTILPDSKPVHISVARNIKKHFTGNLDEEIISFPSFPGRERHYLRSQIARISATTQISPLGFYYFEEDEGEEESLGEKRNEYIENVDFEPLPVTDLADPTMAFWVHHTSYILVQGRVQFWKHKEPYPSEEEEEEEEGWGDTPDQTGPPLLTPLSEDVGEETIVPWTTRLSTLAMSPTAVVLVKSNLWPGAYTFAVGRKFENIYIGWGVKFQCRGHQPPRLPAVQKEYETGPNIIELMDSSQKLEKQWNRDHPVVEQEVFSEGAEEEDEEMDEEEDDEDDNTS